MHSTNQGLIQEFSAGGENISEEEKRLFLGTHTKSGTLTLQKNKGVPLYLQK